MHLPHEEHEHSNNEQDREARNQQLRPDRLLLGLLSLDYHVVRQQIIHQLGVFDHRANGFETAAIFALGANGQAIYNDLREPVGLHFANKRRVAHLLGAAAQIEIIENREQYRGDQQPQQQIFSHIVHNESSRFRATRSSRGRTV